MWMIWAASSAWTGYAQAQTMEFPWWAWIFIVVFLVFLLFGLWTRARGKGVVKPEKDLISAANEPRSQPRPKPASMAAPEPQVEMQSSARLAAAAQARPDDLKIVEGIGSKIAAILKEAGISSFAQLAATKPSELRGILKAAEFRAPADPATWPEQARLAAAGDWEALQKLQERLKGGRKVE
jgi:predicted flap endonuclease-1-like 5' DNA nuclease